MDWPDNTGLLEVAAWDFAANRYPEQAVKVTHFTWKPQSISEILNCIGRLQKCNSMWFQFSGPITTLRCENLFSVFSLQVTQNLRKITRFRIPENIQYVQG